MTRHSRIIKSTIMSEHFWDKPVVMFWAVKDKTLVLVGGRCLCTNAILTAAHVLDSLQVLKAQAAQL